MKTPRKSLAYGAFWYNDVVDALIDGGSERLVMLMRISSKSDRKERSYGGCGNVSDCNL